MLTVFVRSIITYILLLCIMRLMGKRQLSQLQPFEFTITLIIAELACIPMSETSLPLSYGVIPMFTLFVLHFTITKLASKNIRINRFLNGEPVIVMTPKGIDYRLLEKLSMSVTDLLHALRSAGYFYPSQVAYAILETNGQLSVMAKSQFSPLTADSSNVQITDSEIPYPVICEGRYLDNNLELSGIEKVKIEALLEREHLRESDILLLTVNDGKEIFMQPFKGNAIIVNV